MSKKCGFKRYFRFNKKITPTNNYMNMNKIKYVN